MVPEEALQAAKSILANRPDKNLIKVLVDNPNDCKPTINAFKKLGCKVKVEKDGAVLMITRGEVAQ